MRKTIAILTALLFLFAGCGKRPVEKTGTTDQSNLNEEQIELMEKHPDFFGLDFTNGLDVLVCQFASEHYSFTLLEHSETPRDMNDPEMWFLDGVYAREMREILATYPVTREDVYIIPWYNPVSSYIADYFMFSDDSEADAARKKEYIDKILDMLFDGTGAKLEVYDHIEKKGEKTVQTFFSEDQAKELRGRKEKGELFTLTYDEVKYIVDDSIWKYNKYDEIILTGANAYGIVPGSERQESSDHHIYCNHEDLSKLPAEEANQKNKTAEKDLYIIITYRLAMLDSSFAKCELYRTHDSVWMSLDGAPATLIWGDGKYGMSSIDVDPPVPASTFFLKSFAEADSLDSIMQKTSKDYMIYNMKTFLVTSSSAEASEKFRSKYYDGIRDANMEFPLLMTRFSEDGCTIVVADFTNGSSARLFPQNGFSQSASQFEWTE